MRHPGYTPVGLTPDDLQGECNGPPDDENGDNRGGLLPIPGPQVRWQQPSTSPSLSPISPSLPSHMHEHAPSPSLSVLSYQPSWLATPPSPPYDKNFFNSYQEYQDWLQRRANYRPPTPETEEVRVRKIVEMLKH